MDFELKPIKINFEIIQDFKTRISNVLHLI